MSMRDRNQAPPRVTMINITKHFGRVTALSGVDFSIAAGEVHALLGENGAGKTTLMNILYGLVTPDDGAILVDGEPVHVRGPAQAVALGIGMVHQNFKLVPTLTVTENMLLGERGVFLRHADLEAVRQRLQELGDRFGLEVDPSARVWQLSVGEQQRVDILRALYHDVSVLILDEPTANLAPVEIEQLFPKLQALAAEGLSIILITHHLGEVAEWTDRVTVLRRGKNVSTLRSNEASQEDLARLMVGPEVSLAWTSSRHTVPTPSAEVVPDGGVLQVSGLEARGDRGTLVLREVSFSVSRGEIVAIAGVEGNGQAELEEVLYGLRSPVRGVVTLNGKDITSAEPAQRLQCGMGLIPSDRFRRGLIAELSVSHNLVYDRIDRAPFGSPFSLHSKAIMSGADELTRRFGIRIWRLTQAVSTLSGGNAQRVVLARILGQELCCIVAAQPTRGLDVGAVRYVWDQLDAARQRGVAILLISTDLDEVLELADRCLTLYRGSLVKSSARGQMNREQIGLAMGGVVAGGLQA